jgi:hypothetical protein
VFILSLERDERSMTVTVKLDGTYYYGPRGNKIRYGPGDAVEVPEGLATALGLTPLAVPQLARAAAEPETAAGESDPLEPFPALRDAGYTVETTRAASDEELLAVKGIGRATLRQIREALG